MSEAHAILTDYADELVSVPRAHLRMELAQDEAGLTLKHEGNTVVHCRLTREGMIAGGFLSQALGQRFRRWERLRRSEYPRVCCTGRWLSLASTTVSKSLMYSSNACSKRRPRSGEAQLSTASSGGRTR